MSDSVRPHRRQPTRLPRPWDSPGKNTGVGCHFLLQCVKMKSESEVAQSRLTLSDMGCHFLLQGVFRLRDGTNVSCISCIACRYFTTEASHLGSPNINTLLLLSHFRRVPIDGSPPGSPSLGFSRQEHWSGLPFPSPMRENEK